MLESLDGASTIVDGTIENWSLGIAGNFEIDARPVVVVRRVAFRGTSRGIYAPGAVDLGGNVAHGNEPQCVGVTCS